MTSYLLPLLWILSFAAAFMPMARYEAYFFTGSFVMLALAFCFQFLKRPLPVFAAPVTTVFVGLVLTFWALALASVAFSQIPTVSFIYFCFFSVFPLGLLCSMAASDKRVFFAVAGTGAGVILATLSMASLVEFFFLPDSLLFGRVHWPFADPNSLGGILSLGFFCGIGVMMAAPNRMARNTGLLLAVLMIGAIFTTGSRGAVAALAGGLLVFGFSCWPQVKKHKRCAAVLFVAAVMLYGLTQYHPAPSGESIGYRIAETVKGAEPVLWSRPAIWESAWAIAREHLWTGTGIGTFFLYYPEVRSPLDKTTAGRMAHSDPLQFWAEMGVFAPLVFYLFIALAGWMTWRAIRVLPRDDVRRVYVMAPACALGAMIAHSHITFHFYVLAILMAAGPVLGFWLRQARDIAGENFGELRPLPLPRGDILKVLVIAPVLAGLYGFLILQGSHMLYDQGNAKGIAGDLAGFSRDVNKAGRMGLGLNTDALVMAAQVKISQLDAQGGIPRPGAGDLYDEGMEFLDRAEALNPRRADVPYYKFRLARCSALLRLEKKDEPKERQEEFLQTALRLNPLYYPARIDLAKFYKRRKEPDREYAVLKEGMKWVQAANVPPEYYELLAKEALAHGDGHVNRFALRHLGRNMGITPENDEKK